MTLQFKRGTLDVIYYGEISQAIDAARFYEHIGKYELDILKARELVGIQTLICALSKVSRLSSILLYKV